MVTRLCFEGGIFRVDRPEVSLIWNSRVNGFWRHEVTVKVEGKLVSVSGGGMTWGEEFFLVVPNNDSDGAKAVFAAELKRKLTFAFDNSRCESPF